MPPQDANPTPSFGGFGLKKARVHGPAERHLSNREINTLNESFGDIMVNGRIKRTKALAAEKDEPDLLSKPQIAFPYDGKSPGRLYQMVLRLNGMADG